MILLFSSFAIVLSQIIIDVIVRLISFGKFKFFDFISLKTMLIDFFCRWLFAYVLYFIMYLILGFYFENTFSQILVFIIIAIMSIYSYALQPFIFLRDKKMERSKIYEDRFKDILLGNKIYKHKNNFNNAYAIGMLKHAKAIVISNDLIENMSDSELKGIIAHEVGHLKQKHIFKLYLAFVVAIAIGYFCSTYILPLTFAKLPIPEALQHALGGGIFYGLPIWIIPSLTQRVLEYEADAYAGTLAGKEHIIAALNKLDEMSGGKVSQGNLAYPTLEQRIANILKS